MLFRSKSQDEASVRVSIDAGISPAREVRAEVKESVQQVTPEDKSRADTDKAEDPGSEKERQSSESQKKSRSAKKTDTQQGSLF